MSVPKDKQQKKRRSVSGVRRKRQTVRRTPPNDFLMFELGIDLADSKAFKTQMESLHNAKDLTPRLDGVTISLTGTGVSFNTPDHEKLKKKHNGSYQPKTYESSERYTYLSEYHPDGAQHPQFKAWFQKVKSKCPMFLYLSGHQGGGFAGGDGVFYNNLHFAFSFGMQTSKHTLEFGEDAVLKLQNNGSSYVPEDRRTEAGKRKQYIAASVPRFSSNLLAVIADGCNVCAPQSMGGLSVGQRIQQRLKTKQGMPVILSFGSKSPASGTADLHEAFVKKLPTGVPFWNTFKKGTAKQDELVKFWLEAGKAWNRKHSKRHGNRDVWAVSHDGKLITDVKNGKLIQGVP